MATRVHRDAAEHGQRRAVLSAHLRGERLARALERHGGVGVEALDRGRIGLARGRKAVGELKEADGGLGRRAIEPRDAALKVAERRQPALDIGDGRRAVPGAERARFAKRGRRAGIDQRAGRRVGGPGRLEGVGQLKGLHRLPREFAVFAGTAALEIAHAGERALQAAHRCAGVARRGGRAFAKRIPAQRIAHAEAQLRRAIGHAGLRKAVRHLEPPHGGLRRLAVHAVARAGKIAQIAKPLLHIAHRFAGTAHL